MAKGFKAYDNGRYEEAISYFEQVEDEQSVLLYLGNSYLALDKAEEAIPLFEKLIEEYDVFDEQAEWYLVLALLHVGKTYDANKIILNAKKDHLYSDDFEVIMNKF
jgi:tetratricopeptide (TPR) repeat protein